MKTRLLAVALTVLSTGRPATAQDVPATLSLSQAVEIARTSNPGFLQTRNDEALADWDVRQSWGQLLPTANAFGGMSWQGPGEQQFGTLTLGDLGFTDQPAYYGSSYGLNLGYQVDWARLNGPKQARAQRDATLGGIDVAEANLISQVTAAYIDVLRQDDGVRIAQQQLENAEFNLRLAQGQLEVGQVTPIDVGQAEVQVGRAQVTLLQSSNAATTSRMRLLQLLGLPVDQTFEPSSAFVLAEPGWDLEDLIEMAMGGNPELLRRQSSTRAAEVGVTSAWSSYMPSLSLNAGWGGFTREASNVDFQIAQAQAGVQSSIAQCVRTNDLYSRLANPLPPLDCGSIAFTDAQRQAIISQNDQFPFNFTQSPFRLSATVSVPIFTGLNRQRNLEAARLQRDDFQQQVREQELAVRADLSIGLENTRTLYESALLEDRNRELAEQQLNLARERYQLGAITFVELVDAQTVFVQADADRTRALFAYHDSVTTLEALIGASLR
jgi:outer membrane protein